MDDICKEYPEIPTIFPKVKRIIAIGDIHGDFILALNLLKLGHLIDDKNEWIGNDTYVVQIGDQIDRCRPSGKHSCIMPDSTFEDEGNDIRILEFLTNLDKQAIKEGGRVISLIGNHELLNILSQFQYVSHKSMDEDYGISDEEYEKNNAKTAEEKRKYAFERGNKYANFIACTRKSAVIIGSFLFIHAGVVLEHLKKYGIDKRDKLEKLNDNIASWILKLLDKKKIYEYIVSTKSIFWSRILGELPKDLPMSDPQCKKNVAKTLKTFNIKGIICGHTPQFLYDNGISKTCDESVFRIDTGSSRAFHYFDKKHSEARKPQILEILNDGEKINILTV